MHGYTILNGGDLDENGDSEEGKPIMHGYITSHGGDLNENKHFKMRKLIIHGYKKCMPRERS